MHKHSFAAGQCHCMALAGEKDKNLAAALRLKYQAVPHAQPLCRGVEGLNAGMMRIEVCTNT